MRPCPAKIKVFSDAEVLEAIDLILKMEPDAWKALEDHELGKDILEQSQYHSYYDLTWSHLRQLDFVETLIDISGLRHQIRMEMRRRLGLAI